MDADVTISHNGSQEYNIIRNFDDSTREVVCFSYIVDQILSDTSSEHRQEVTFGNVVSCFYRSNNETWKDLEQLFGEFEVRNPLPRTAFSASY